MSSVSELASFGRGYDDWFYIGQSPELFSLAVQEIQRIVEEKGIAALSEAGVNIGRTAVDDGTIITSVRGGYDEAYFSRITLMDDGRSTFESDAQVGSLPLDGWSEIDPETDLSRAGTIAGDILFKLTKKVEPGVDAPLSGESTVNSLAEIETATVQQQGLLKRLGRTFLRVK